MKLMENEVFFRWGYLEHVLSDNGSQFLGRIWPEACRCWQSEPWTTPIYHPRANLMERRNQELKKALKLQLKGKSHFSWNQKLPSILFSLHHRSNATTGILPSWALLE